MIENPSEGIDLHLDGFMVNQCIFDSGFTICMVRPPQIVPNQENNLLRIEAPFNLELEGVMRHCDIERDLQSACPALALLWRVVEAAHINGQGELQITFSGGVVVRIPSDPDYETWTLNSATGLMVSRPGGGIARFPSTSY